MKSNRHILILDIGSGSGRAIVFDTSGKEVSFAQTEWLPKMLPEYPGSQVFDTKEAWKILSLCIQQALIRGSVPPESIIGISATSMREGMVLYDRKQREIWACPNVDARAGTEAVEMLEMGIAEKLYDISGSWLNIIAPPRFRWIKKYEPEIFKNVKHISMLSDWALYKLSGQIVTDPTIGSSSGLFDLHARTWSDEAIEMCELPQHIFPPVFESGSVIGEVTKEAAMQTGLKAGTPVITGGGR